MKSRILLTILCIGSIFLYFSNLAESQEFNPEENSTNQSQDCKDFPKIPATVSSSNKNYNVSINWTDQLLEIYNSDQTLRIESYTPSGDLAFIPKEFIPSGDFPPQVVSLGAPNTITNGSEEIRVYIFSNQEFIDDACFLEETPLTFTLDTSSVTDEDAEPLKRGEACDPNHTDPGLICEEGVSCVPDETTSDASDYVCDRGEYTCGDKLAQYQIDDAKGPTSSEPLESWCPKDCPKLVHSEGADTYACIVPPPPGPPCTKIEQYIDKSWVPKDDYDPNDLDVDENGKVIPFRCVETSSALNSIKITPNAFIAWLLAFLLSISGMVALVLIIRSGYQLMTAGDNAEAVQEARERIIGAIVGLLFILFSLVIFEVIGVDLLHLPGFRTGDTQEAPVDTSTQQNSNAR